MAINGTNGVDIKEGTPFADEFFGFDGNDTFAPGKGADTVDGGQGQDTVDYGHAFRLLPPNMNFGGNSIDVDLERSVQIGGFADGDVLISIENVAGSEEEDTIRGNDDDNVFHGSGADDLLEGRGGDDVLFGDGDDTAVLILVGVDGNDHLDGGFGNDVLFGQGGDDTLVGGIDNDQLFGGDGDDFLRGGQGIDVLDGGAGIDWADYDDSSGNVVVQLNTGFGFNAHAGGDTLFNIENVGGSRFGDSLTGNSVANVLLGRDGNDTLDGRAGADTLDGGDGSDTASYVASASGVVVDLAAGTATGGDAQNDTLISIENLIGSSSIDALYGDALGNTLDGGGNVDLLVGRAGNDVYIVDNAGDAVVESANQGADEVRASVSYTLATNQAIETLSTTSGSGTAAINLTGNNLDQQINGNNGNNVLNGAGGDDLLIGARGVDILTGGSGADFFLWRNPNESGTVVAAMDLITDFNPLAGDLIDLSGIDASIIAAGNQAFTFIGAAAFSGNPGEVNFIQVGGETIIQIQTGVEVDIEMGIRIAGLVTPQANWFVL